ncbi:hypothetical protein F444_22796 [Phytophthora nicotianae P1976]|uniref:Uncharacterized protein n=1 Tax=Phytophthora nicotianae P1976 TaxID=1317066 RepID=A0A080YWQ9_PHYNI|nr:hypothetical protein F444_22796 [Phytophthora nicotianae P1976]
MCPSTTSTCWDKFHQFYLPNGLFTDKGNVRRHSELAKLRDEHEPRTQKPRKVAARHGLGGDGLSADHSIGLDAFGPNGSATHRLAIYSGPGGAGRGGAGTRGLGGAGVNGGATVELGGTGCGRAGARGLVDAAGVDGGAALGHNDAGRVGAGARGLCGAALGLGGATVVGVTGRGGAAGRALGDASGLDGGSTLRLGDDGVNGGTARGLDGTGRGLSGAVLDLALPLDLMEVRLDWVVEQPDFVTSVVLTQASVGLVRLLVLLALVVVTPGDLVILHVWLVAVQQDLVELVESAAVYFVMPLMYLVALKLGLMVLVVVKPVLADMAKILTSGKCDILPALAVWLRARRTMPWAEERRRNYHPRHWHCT